MGERGERVRMGWGAGEGAVYPPPLLPPSLLTVTLPHRGQAGVRRHPTSRCDDGGSP